MTGFLELLTIVNFFLTVTLLYFQIKTPPTPDEKWVYFNVGRHSTLNPFAMPGENAVLPPKDYKFASAWQVDNVSYLTCRYKRLIRRKDPLEIYAELAYNELTHGSP